jgi:hypothetical protein
MVRLPDPPPWLPGPPPAGVLVAVMRVEAELLA